MRRTLVAANWKMNGSKDLVRSLIDKLRGPLSSLDNGVGVVIIPPALYVSDVSEQIAGTGFELGVQNIARWSSGAYTGEIAASMVADSGVAYTLVGHSERRQLFGETNEDVAEKVRQALDNQLAVILCVGETLSEREAGNAEQVVRQQVTQGLAGVTGKAWQQVIIAYEPVWAIGSGKTATAEDAQAMHLAIRALIGELDGPADEVSLLYGGSVKPDNAAALFAQPDIDGGLIGGASLIAEDFIRICQSA